MIFRRLRQWSLLPIFALLAGLMLGAGAKGALAAAGKWAKSDLIEARLVAASEGTGNLAQLPLAVEIKIKDGWKTYWRSPGEAGLAPSLDWTGSENLQSAEISWPVPSRFSLFGLQTFGYAKYLALPIAATVREPGKPLELTARLDVLVCADVCVPQNLPVSLSLPAGGAAPGPEAQIVARAQSLVPGGGEAVGLELVSLREVAITDEKGTRKPGLEVVARSAQPFDGADVFIETDPAIQFDAPRLDMSRDGTEATLRLAAISGLPEGQALAGRDAVLTLADGQRGAEFRQTVEVGESVADDAPYARLALMLSLAVLGGLILNLMPCVLPVLSLKLLSVVSKGGQAPARVRMSFLATAAGILASFMLLAAGLAALKAAGLAIGWGIQFQQPVFIAVMALLVVLFACNLWGFFEVPMPQWLGGASAGQGKGLWGDFGTGALATLLATPCSAPFLGTAVGFALAGSIGSIFAIFAALGVGLALPYLLVAAAPRLATRLPKPGRWMITLRRILGFALAATAVWLLSVMAVQVSPELAAGIGLLLIAVIAVLGMHRWRPGVLPRRATWGATLALSLAAVVVPGLGLQEGMAARQTAPGEEKLDWVAFDRARIRALVAQGETVFVDVTADWCITCQANKKFVIDTEEITQALSQVVTMRADWTNPDQTIADFLASYGRYGIPFNIVYGPGDPGGIVLPELLSKSAVLEALKSADRSGAGWKGANNSK